MEYLKSYKLFESDELSEYIDTFIKPDIEDDKLSMWEISVIDFLYSKYKNQPNKEKERRKELKKYMYNTKGFTALRTLNKQKENCLCLHIGSFFNIDDVEIYLRRMLEYANEHGYYYEIRKELQASRKSIDITNLFNRRLARKNNRVNTQKILSIQILFYKE